MTRGTNKEQIPEREHVRDVRVNDLAVNVMYLIIMSDGTLRYYRSTYVGENEHKKRNVLW
jgi:hypothetical protein